MPGIRINLDTSQAYSNALKLKKGFRVVGDASQMTEKEIKDLEKLLGKGFGTKNASKIVNDFSKSLKKTANEAKKAQSQVDKSFKGMSQSVKLLGGALVSLGTIYALKRMTEDIVGVGAAFEQQMATVKGVTRASAQEFAMLQAEARKMGETTEWSASQSAQALQYLGMAGLSASEATQALSGTLDLATAGGIDLGRAADIATDTLTAMGMQVNDLGRVNDVFAATITRSNTNIEMMGESMKYVAPVASQMGYDIEKASAMIGILGTAGIKSSMAGTSLTQALMRTGKAAKKLGMDEGSNLIDVLKEINKQQLSVNEVTDMFGMYAAKGVLALRANIDKYEELEKAVRNAKGESKELADTMRNTTAGAMKELSSTLESIKLDIFADHQQEVTEAIKDATEWIRENKEELKALGDALSVTVQGFVGLFKVLGGAVDLMGTFIGGIKTTAQILGIASEKGVSFKEAINDLANQSLKNTGTDAFIKQIDTLNVKIQETEKEIEKLQGKKKRTGQDRLDLATLFNDLEKYKTKLKEVQEETKKTWQKQGQVSALDNSIKNQTEDLSDYTRELKTAEKAYMEMNDRAKEVIKDNPMLGRIEAVKQFTEEAKEKFKDLQEYDKKMHKNAVSSYITKEMKKYDEVLAYALEAKKFIARMEDPKLIDEDESIDQQIERQKDLWSLESSHNATKEKWAKWRTAMNNKELDEKRKSFKAMKALDDELMKNAVKNANERMQADIQAMQEAVRIMKRQKEEINNTFIDAFWEATESSKKASEVIEDHLTDAFKKVVESAIIKPVLDTAITDQIQELSSFISSSLGDAFGSGISGALGGIAGGLAGGLASVGIGAVTNKLFGKKSSGPSKNDLYVKAMDKLIDQLEENKVEIQRNTAALENENPWSSEVKDMSSYFYDSMQPLVKEIDKLTGIDMASTLQMYGPDWVASLIQNAGMGSFGLGPASGTAVQALDEQQLAQVQEALGLILENLEEKAKAVAYSISQHFQSMIDSIINPKGQYESLIGEVDSAYEGLLNQLHSSDLPGNIIKELKDQITDATGNLQIPDINFDPTALTSLGEVVSNLDNIEGLSEETQLAVDEINELNGALQELKQHFAEVRDELSVNLQKYIDSLGPFQNEAKNTIEAVNAQVDSFISKLIDAGLESELTADEIAALTEEYKKQAQAQAAITAQLGIETGLQDQHNQLTMSSTDYQALQYQEQLQAQGLQIQQWAEQVPELDWQATWDLAKDVHGLQMDTLKAQKKQSEINLADNVNAYMAGIAGEELNSMQAAIDDVNNTFANFTDQAVELGYETDVLADKQKEALEAVKSIELGKIMDEVKLINGDLTEYEQNLNQVNNKFSDWMESAQLASASIEELNQIQQAWNKTIQQTKKAQQDAIMNPLLGIQQDMAFKQSGMNSLDWSIAQANSLLNAGDLTTEEAGQVSQMMADIYNDAASSWDDAIDSQNEVAKLWEDAGEKAEDLIRSIESAQRNIKYSDLNVGLFKEKEESAKQDYEELLQAANSGNQEAIQEYMSFASDYLSIAQENHKSDQKYQDIYKKVLADMDAVKAGIQPEMLVDKQQLRAAENAVRELQNSNMSLDEVKTLLGGMWDSLKESVEWMQFNGGLGGGGGSNKPQSNAALSSDLSTKYGIDVNADAAMAKWLAEEWNPHSTGGQGLESLSAQHGIGQAQLQLDADKIMASYGYEKEREWIDNPSAPGGGYWGGYLGEGGIAFKETRAIIGEKGTEVVAPLSDLPKYFTPPVQDNSDILRLLERLVASQNKSQPTNLTLIFEQNGQEVSKEEIAMIAQKMKIKADRPSNRSNRYVTPRRSV